jgi:hypothetical protein
LPIAAWSLGWRTPLSWLIAIACIALAWRRYAALERLTPPAAPILLEEVRADLENSSHSSEDGRRFAIAELNQRIADISFELGLLPTTFTTLIRISLASGSALALLGLMELGRTPLESALGAGVCAVSGLVGAGVVAAIGRTAKQRVLETRAEWDRASREVGKELGTSLEAAAPERADRARRPSAGARD